MTHKNNK